MHTGIRLGLATVCLGFAFGAGAMTTVQTVPCALDAGFSCVTGITGLVVQGQAYDLAVTVGRFDQLFPDPAAQLPTWDRLDFARALNEAVSFAVGATGASSLNTRFYDSGPDDRSEFLLHHPVAYHELFGNPQGAFDGPCSGLTDFGVVPGNCAIWQTDAVLAFGVLTAVPELPTGALLLAGSALLGLRLRRRA